VVLLRERLSQTFLFRPPKPKPGDPEPVKGRAMTDEEKGRWIRGLEPIERKWAYILAAYSAVLSFVITLPQVVSVHYVATKITSHGHTHTGYVSTQQSSEILLGVQMLLVLGMLLSTRLRKRSILAFCLLIAGFAADSLLGLPLIVLAGWLFMRSWRVQRYGTADAKVVAKLSAERRAQGRQSGGGGVLQNLFGRRSTSTSATSSTSTAARASTRSATDTASRSVPEASKRYTPKKDRSKEDKSLTGRNRYQSAAKGGTKR
jgi:hypothetical protein